MVEEYDPDAFAIRVSQRLFHVLSGRAVEPGPIEARTRREASLIEAVRREGRAERLALLRRLKDDELKQAHAREQKAQKALDESVSVLDARLRDLNMPVEATKNDSPTPLPCDSFRQAVIACYKSNAANAIACAADVDAFTECAKQLTKVKSV